MKRVRRSDVIRTIFSVASIAALTALAPAHADARSAAADRNHDRIPDRWEIRHHLSLKHKQTFANQDRDELFNLFELRAGTDPRKADTDGDGILDGQEDPDGDGLTNMQEQYLHTNPRKADSDRNGTKDGDEDKDSDGAANVDEFADETDPMSACTGDARLGFELRTERKLRIHFRSVRRWYDDATWFDGKVDDDCGSSDDECTDEPIDLLFDGSGDEAAADDGAGTDGSAGGEDCPIDEGDDMGGDGKDPEADGGSEGGMGGGGRPAPSPDGGTFS